MRKVEIVAASCIALLAIVSIGQWYLDRQPDPSQEKPKQIVQTSQAETVAVTADEVVETYLPAVKEGTDVGRQVALGSLLDDLEGPEYLKAALTKQNASDLSEAAIAIAQTTGDDQPSDELKSRIAGFIAGRVRGTTARDYSLKVLNEGSPAEKQAALDGVMIGRGIGGAQIFAKISEMGGQGLIPGEQLPGLLWRSGGSKAVEAITTVMKSTDDAKVISACVVALQNAGDAKVMGPILERLEAVGLIDKPKTGPWISAPLFGKYMETAEGSALSRGVKLMAARPVLVKRAMPSIVAALSKGDAETRLNAADAVKKAVTGKHIDEKQGDELLASQLKVETEPVLKAQLPSDPKTPESKPQ